jgi:hypothetical protein
MTPQELNRYKGQFIKGKTKRIKQPSPNATVHFDGNIQVTNCKFSHNGWIAPKKGAL